MDPVHLAGTFCSRQIYGIGSAVREFQERYNHGLRPWYRCAPESAGNGALMRIAPALIPHLRSQTAGLRADAALAATLTHNQASSTAACVAWISMLWRLRGMATPPEPAWWPAAFVSVARRLEGQTLLTPRGGDGTDYAGPLWRFVEQYVPVAFLEVLPVREAGDRWHGSMMRGRVSGAGSEGRYRRSCVSLFSSAYASVLTPTVCARVLSCSSCMSMLVGPSSATCRHPAHLASSWQGSASRAGRPPERRHGSPNMPAGSRRSSIYPILFILYIHVHFRP